ncbi:terminase small subunit [Burkholderia lata]|uniref:terminase small subunit n=1 Tax=Burkholderia lata (strain ATCC 17760 / DSM 23089 / LMG 22485 / NCIMB 9086 / R18194 / 383) TaxID=482957 RepID=UPI0015822C59|nr:terminase small subunit [Burkholderia lata]
MDALTARQRCFVEEYLVDLNATKAAIRAGYSERNADKLGSQLLGKTRVAEAIRVAVAERAARAEVTAAEILRQVDAIATADPNGIVQYRRECCRYCHGEGHEWQYKTEREREGAKLDYEQQVAKLKILKIPRAAWPKFRDGGLGFNPLREPHAGCPECNGEGHGRMFIADTRTLTPAQLALYGGVEITRDGIRILINPKMKALELAMRHRGMLKERIELEVTDALAERLQKARRRVNADGVTQERSGGTVDV